MRHRTLAALLAAIAMVAGACSNDATEQTTPDDTQTTQPADSPTSTADGSTSDGFAYTIAIFEDLTTDNYWAYLDPESSVWNGYVLAAHAPALFQYSLPDLALVPQLADGLPAEPVQEGDTWTVTQHLLEGVEWSDGEPIDAEDIIFTYEVVRDLNLGGNWLLNYPIAAADDPATDENDSNLGLLAIEAPDPHTVVYVFNASPGLSVWQFGVGSHRFSPSILGAARRRRHHI